MAEDQARERLAQALSKIEKRIEAAEARPDVEEIETLKKQREADLTEIKKLRAEIRGLIEDE